MSVRDIDTSEAGLAAELRAHRKQKRRATLKALPPRRTHEEVEALLLKKKGSDLAAYELFHKLEHNGHLSYKGLADALRMMMDEAGVRSKVDHDTLYAKLDEADANGDHVVDFDEFVQWYNACVDCAKAAARTHPSQDLSRGAPRAPLGARRWAPRVLSPQGPNASQSTTSKWRAEWPRRVRRKSRGTGRRWRPHRWSST